MVSDTEASRFLLDPTSSLWEFNQALMLTPGNLEVVVIVTMHKTSAMSSRAAIF